VKDYPFGVLQRKNYARGTGAVKMRIDKLRDDVNMIKHTMETIITTDRLKT
jgi:hypothetical protein